VLRHWREQSGDGQHVLDSSTGFKTAWSHVLKRAKITSFRRHDLRHHFASRLLQRGVPLNTVRDLLGHSSVAMSLRYAHLAPDQRWEAVAKLNEKPLLALTKRLPWNEDPSVASYAIDSIGGKGGTRTLDPGIMRKNRPKDIVNSEGYTTHSGRCVSFRPFRISNLADAAADFPSHWNPGGYRQPPSYRPTAASAPPFQQ
jgi:hypothetical protein